jgi:hypothetical protein
MSIFGSDKTFAQPIDWTTSFFIGAFHVGAVAARSSLPGRHLLWPWCSGGLRAALASAWVSSIAYASRCSHEAS